MGYVTLELCDTCGQEKAFEDGHAVTTTKGLYVMWFCADCKERCLHG